MKDIFVQGIGFLGTILFFLSYQCRSNKNLFRLQLISYLCYTSHLLMLGALTGGISYILNTIRSFCLGSRNDFLKSKWMCWILCALQLLTLAFTWNGWLSLLPIGANIASTLGGYTFNGRKIRIAGMFINSPLWIIYDVCIGSWAGVVDELVTEISMLISIYRYGCKNLDRVEK